MKGTNMRSVSIIVITGIIILNGCGSTTVATTSPIVTAVTESAQMTSPAASEEQVIPMPLPQCAVPGDVEETVASGEIDWSGNTIRAAGTGVLDPDNPNVAQAMLMAERAAVVIAQRNLLETVQGVRVDSETRVENFMTDYDVVYTRVEGIVTNARQIGQARYDSIAGTIEVELEMEIHSPRGLSGALNSVLGSPEMGAVSMSPQTREFLDQYSALVFDGSQAGLQPSMYPKIYDADGNLLLDTADYSSYLGSAGQTAMQFITDLDQILAQPVFSQSPLVLNVRQVTGQFGSDIVLGQGESDTLGWLRSGLPFLMSAGRFLLNVL